MSLQERNWPVLLPKQSETSSFLSALVSEQRKNKPVNVIKFTLTSQVIRISVCLVAGIVMIVGDNFEGSVYVVDVFCCSCLTVLSESHIIFLWAVWRRKIVICMPQRRIWEQKYSCTCNFICSFDGSRLFSAESVSLLVQSENHNSSRINSDTTMLWDSCPLSLSTQRLLVLVVQLLSPRTAT